MTKTKSRQKARELSSCCKAPIEFFAATHWPVISGNRCTKCRCECEVPRKKKKK